MKYRVECVVKGGMGRPSYDGYVDIYVYEWERDVDFQQKVCTKLRSTTFPGLWKNDVVIKNIQVMTR